MAPTVESGKKHLGCLRGPSESSDECLVHLCASSVGCSSPVTLPCGLWCRRSWSDKAEIYAWHTPALPRSGLAKRLINGLSSSTLGLQAQSAPWFSAVGKCTPAEPSTSLGGRARGGGGSRYYFSGSPGTSTCSPPYPIWVVSAHRSVSLGGTHGVFRLICSQDGDHCLRP